MVDGWASSGTLRDDQTAPQGKVSSSEQRALKDIKEEDIPGECSDLVNDDVGSELDLCGLANLLDGRPLGVGEGDGRSGEQRLAELDSWGGHGVDNLPEGSYDVGEVGR